ncbi:protein LONGIFOLIA 1 [Quillaja saponaria]|uniref:Protein LONGIFOLIA 1 n=1 Tax=Quillaja saponaria TaxID=32244 RepID=A0AAD7Q0V7_QUISA|nr:protein LONGIFOLIA 1 [Quillaja saponaria]
MSIDTPRKVNDSVEHRRISPVQSPKVSSRRIVLEQQVANRSPRMRKPTAEIYYKEEKVFAPAEDESSTISESSISTCSQTDIDHRLKAEEYNEGRNLLERCDKLLHSIAEITTTELQPSPVSVLDSSFYKDESSSPSPVLKRSIDYKDQAVQSEDDNWSLAMSSIEAKSEEMSEDCDYIYVSEILRASNFLPQDDSDLFLLLEKQQYLKGKETCKGSRLERRLIFDTINEILNRNRQLPPWKAVSMGGGQTSLIWSEFQRIRERDESEDLLEVICGVLRKDLAEDAIHGWGNCPIEMGDTVLDIERLIFKDLIGEAIGDLAAFGGQFNNKVSALRRKLVF